MSKKLSGAARFSALGSLLGDLLPNLNEVFTNEDDFISVSVKSRPDGSSLAVVKRFGADGGPMVLFGSGYGFAGALMAADQAVQGGRWRPDKPFKNGNS